MAILKVKASATGSYNETLKFLKAHNHEKLMKKLHKYGQMGVEALMAATPKDTGLTAASWRYEIQENNGYAKIRWVNDNLAKGKHQIPIVVLIQYGHVTKGGHYVEGIDFINPAIKPILDKMVNEAWVEVRTGE